VKVLPESGAKDERTEGTIRNPPTPPPIPSHFLRMKNDVNIILFGKPWLLLEWI